MQSSSASVHLQILALFLLFCMSKASGGSCLSYGHSCWGGHGKRGGPGHLSGSTSQKRTSEWYISKLFGSSNANPTNIEALFKNLNPDTEEGTKYLPFGYQIYHMPNVAENIPRDEPGYVETETKATKWDSDSNESNEELIVFSPNVQQAPISKYRFLKIMNKEGIKKGNND